jgi:DNA modification methylase
MEVFTQVYDSFLERKKILSAPSGFEAPLSAFNPAMFSFERDLTRWGLMRGRAAFFQDCGLGKTFEQIEWGRLVSEYTNMPVLALAPLAVAEQTRAEGAKFGIPVTLCESQADVKPGVNVTNYQKLHKFEPRFSGIILDESSILKSFEGVTRKALTAFSQNIPYRLCCSATPAPNDYMELGTHAEFLGVMSRVEMLATFFVHDSGDTSQWRLKGHARKAYFEWLASWAVAMKRPSDLGYEGAGFTLPPLIFHQHTVASRPQKGRLLSTEVKTLEDRRGARRDSLSERVRVAADLVNSSTEPWVVWCNLNVESKALTKAIHGAVEIRGSGQPDAFKVRAAQDFVSGKIRVLVTKPSMFGFGMNWQHCRNMAFVGLSDSYEQFYQAYHRCWRYGQTQEVHCHVICSQAEGAVVKNIQRKEKLAQELSEGMVKHMATINQTNIQKLTRDTEEYKPTVPMKYFGKPCNGTLVVDQSAQKLLDSKTSPRWLTYHADSVEVLQALPENVIDFSIFSPPFASLYTYTNSERDLGNSHSYKEFFEHFRFIIPELLRVMTPGRLLVCHCANIPATKEHDAYIGIKNFRGHLVDAFEAAGFIYHSEVVIRKDPLVEATRSKAIGLLHKQIIKDSAISRQGLPDYLIVLRKPGTNPKAIQHRPVGFERYLGTRPAPKSKPTDDPMTNKFSHEVWQRYADPVWSDVSQTDTLQFREVREEKDERHICPLQLPVIARALELWTLPNDLVLSPFMGIGSEGYMALRMKRRFVGIELKASYYQMAVKNLIKAANTPERKALF